jgi:ubiquitin-conjugating enzyme E2 R
MSGESAGERWSPAQRVESVLISILSLLDDAEISSPANVDASVQLRDDKDAFIKRVKEDVAKSKEDVPEGFVMPTHESTMQKPVKDDVDDDFWADSDVDEDFMGGSDSDEELNHAYDDDEDDDEDAEDAEPDEEMEDED